MYLQYFLTAMHELTLSDVGFLNGWFLYFFRNRDRKGYHNIKFIHNSTH